MSDEKEQTSVSLRQILTLVALLGGAFWLAVPALQSSRPDGEVASVKHPPQSEGIYARLWQDPFAAAEAASETSGEKIDSNLQAIQTSLNPDKTDEKTLILPVMVDGGPNPENTEQRLRARTAVLAGLAACGFPPSRVEAIDAFYLPELKQEGAKNEGSVVQNKRTLIPYEWCYAGYNNSEATTLSTVNRVLVLWLKDQHFKEAPLATINHLLEELLVHVRNKKPEIRMIGPYLSTTLRSMLIELEKTDRPADVFPYLTWMHIYIATPTVSDAFVTFNTNEDITGIADAKMPLAGNGRNSGKAFPQKTDPVSRSAKFVLESKLRGIKVDRCSPTDDDLVTALIDELRFRRIYVRPGDVPPAYRILPAGKIWHVEEFWPTGRMRQIGEFWPFNGAWPVKFRSGKSKSSETHVAIISEWDTFYGRALPITFAALAGDRDGNFVENVDSLLKTKAYTTTDSGKLQSPWDRIHTFHYMRGLDGRLPAEQKGESEQSSAARNGAKEKEKKEDSIPPDQPEGGNQSDYLLRLASELEKLDRRLTRESGRGLEAVGVLGSDIYDKLMLLRALRPHLVNAVFFTNVLDARLVYSREWTATRNLVVSSPYGLKLHDTLQRQVPPFRDSYQTSLFAAALRCVDAFPKEICLSPRVFEIGKTGAQDITLAGDPKIYPEREGLKDWWTTGNIVKVALLLCFVLFLRFLSENVLRDRRDREEGRLSNWVYPAIIVSVATFAVVLFLVAEDRGEEPFSWLDGMSIWPSNAVRLFAAILAIVFLCRGCGLILRNNKEISDEYCLNVADSLKVGNWAAIKKELEKEPQVEDEWLPGLRFVLRVLGRYICAALQIIWRPIDPPEKGSARDGAWNVSTGTDELRPFLPHLVHVSGSPDSSHARVSPVDVEKLWNQYLRRGQFWYALGRVLPVTLTYVCIVLIILWLFGWPTIPSRGAQSHFVTVVIEIGASLLAVLLTFYVVDATGLCATFVRYLSKGQSRYPAATLERCRQRQQLEKDALLVDRIDIQLIADRTRALGTLIYLPFIIIFLMIVSRINYFDSWSWPMGLIVAYCALCAYAIYSAWLLRNCAETARQDALITVRNRLFEYITKRDHKNAALAREALTDIEKMRDGAFAAFSKHPVFAAILLPSGGFSIWAILQYLGGT